MREAIGGTWIFGIVITFIVLFSSYLAISVNYSKAFRVKNEMVSIIEKYEGYNSTTEDVIDNFIGGIGYGVRGSCNNKGNGFDGKDNRYKYCIECVSTNDTLKRHYYTVTVFFKLDLPVLGNIFTFPVTGTTKSIHFPTDEGTGLMCS